MEPALQISHIRDPNKCVVGPGDAWACPRIYRFILKSENVGQTISDPGQKLIVYTLPSIWQYPLFRNDIKIPVLCQNRPTQKNRWHYEGLKYEKSENWAPCISYFEKHLKMLTTNLCRMAVTLFQTSSWGSISRQNRIGRTNKNTVKIKSSVKSGSDLLCRK